MYHRSLVVVLHLKCSACGTEVQAPDQMSGWLSVARTLQDKTLNIPPPADCSLWRSQDVNFDIGTGLCQWVCTSRDLVVEASHMHFALQVKGPSVGQSSQDMYAYFWAFKAMTCFNTDPRLLFISWCSHAHPRSLAHSISACCAICMRLPTATDPLRAGVQWWQKHA